VQGWSLISTYIDPFEPLVDSVFAPVVGQLVILKDGMGNPYWPQFGLNSIGSLIIGQAYQARMLITQILSVEGTAVQPENEILAIPQGWSMMGYLRNSPADIVTLLSPIVSNIIIIKDGEGNPYWPQWGINVIGNMAPGKGYQINLSASANYTYPANSATIASSKYQQVENSHFIKPIPTEHNMTVCIPLSAWETIPVSGAEIAIFDNNGVLAGTAVFNNTNLAIPVWGNDSYSTEKDGLLPGEEFILKTWDGSEKLIVVENWVEGDDNYEKDKLAVAGKLFQKEIADVLSFQSYPNPVNTKLNISFFLNSEKEVQLILFDQIGQKVWEGSQMFSAGKNEKSIDVSKFGQGTYFLSLNAGNYRQTQVINIVR
ncbi:MAG: T9SS type A sorting domain-containing protein, partial [Bacteroidota bacterium]|nr:T9SS type A sorting domain-containing protein [Bacteroidota bacterium]